MHIVHVEFFINDEDVPAFLNWKQEEGIEQLKAPGFIKRRMYRETERPNVFYYISHWESEPLMMDFVRGGFEQAKARHNAAFPVSYKASKQEIRVVGQVFEDVKGSSE